MANPYIGQILMFAGTFAPSGYLPCDGTQLRIQDYDALYALIGTTYGGDGVNSFSLPDLRSRVPIHNGMLQGGSNYVLGQTGGAANVSLGSTQLGGHTHTLNVVTGTSSGGAANPTPGTYLADELMPVSGQIRAYSTPTQQNLTVLNSASIGNYGAGQPHANVQPNVVITICICTTGTYPS